MATDQRSQAASEPRRRGESSAGTKQNEITKSLKPAASVGKVTRAKFEPLRERDTGDGWGIVHLYRDGDATPGLGGGIEVYHSEDLLEESHVAGKAAASTGLEYKHQGEECTILCVPAVPAYFSPSDFLGFVGEKTREMVSHFRMVMTGQNNMYLVLMKFKDSEFARKWKAQWDGKLFNSIEPEACYVMFIKSITFQTETNTQPNVSFPELSYDPFSPSNSAFTSIKPTAPAANITELPTCPVCLDRMDDSTGLVTILCQHVFHGDCIKKWRGTGCPVCRRTNPALASTSFNYDPENPPFGSGEAPFCSTCDSAEDLWICLLCGNVGCGRYKGGHQKDHWKETAHNLALEIETQHIWDYADDDWAHRSIRRKDDSKIMDPPRSAFENDSQETIPSNERFTDSDTEKGIGSTHVENAHVTTERDIEMRLGHMLQPILDQQRAYFEEQVITANKETEAAIKAESRASALAHSCSLALEELTQSSTQLREENQSLSKDIARERTKAEKSTVLAKSMTKAFQEEKKLSEGLMENNTRLQKQVSELSATVGKQKDEIKDLEEQIRDLYLNMEARDKLKAMDLDEGELEGGSLGVSAGPAGKGRGKGRKK